MNGLEALKSVFVVGLVDYNNFVRFNPGPETLSGHTTRIPGSTRRIPYTPGLKYDVSEGRFRFDFLVHAVESLRVIMLVG
jgi:hypothetical protein